MIATTEIDTSAGGCQLFEAKDYKSGVKPVWCPGCGDYTILKQVQNAMPSLGIPKERIAFVSGIGCSSRFPYYMNTFGFHTIHGRAPGFSAGIKAINPDLNLSLSIFCLLIYSLI